MIAIIDYGVGNLFSLQASLKKIGVDAILTKDEKEIAAADKIILPGVGAFGDAADKLFSSGLADLILKETACGKPLMGICLGMQLLFEESCEFGRHKGLGLVKGTVNPLSEVIPADLKIPQMGWNKLDIAKPGCPIFKYTGENDYVYFVHSYYGVCNDGSLAASTEYGAKITAAVWNKNVFGCQFHPEKSGEVGLRMLRAFAEIKTED